MKIKLAINDTFFLTIFPKILFLNYIILLPDTYLMHGNSEFKNLNVETSQTFNSSDKPDILIKEYKYFDTISDICHGYSLSSKSKGYIGLYKVKVHMQIYGQRPEYSQMYYNTTTEYSSPEAQCLCDNEYNGYCSYYKKNGNYFISDIGLCNYVGKIELIGYLEVNRKSCQKDLKFYKYNKEEIPNIDDSNLLKHDIFNIEQRCILKSHNINDNNVSIECIEKLNQKNIEIIYSDKIIIVSDEKKCEC